MNNIYAVIENGIVINTIQCENGKEWTSDDCDVMSIDTFEPRPGPGWTYDGEKFSPPEMEIYL